jgi:hypothetical protein
LVLNRVFSGKKVNQEKQHHDKCDESGKAFNGLGGDKAVHSIDFGVHCKSADTSLQHLFI